MKWISVKDRLPEPFVSVLGYCPESAPYPTVREMYLAEWRDTNGSRELEWMYMGGVMFGEVTHWADMPEPPEEV